MYRPVFLTVALLALAGFGQAALAADKVTICHKGVQTASVAAQAVSAHEAHGDTLGACGESQEPSAQTMAAVVMMRCEPSEGAVSVVAFSSSPAVETSSEDCAVVLGELLDSGYVLRSITSGSAGDSTLHLYTDYLLVGRAPVPEES
jgi:hypothetical protein